MEWYAGELSNADEKDCLFDGILWGIDGDEKEETAYGIHRPEDQMSGPVAGAPCFIAALEKQSRRRGRAVKCSWKEPHPRPLLTGVGIT